MIDNEKFNRCREKLIETARSDGYVTYAELAKHIGASSRRLGPYLDAIYDEAKKKNPLRDLGLVVVYAGTHYGRYNSRGGPTRSVKVDRTDAAQVAEYDRDLADVRSYWKNQPRA